LRRLCGISSHFESVKQARNPTTIWLRTKWSPSPTSWGGIRKGVLLLHSSLALLGRGTAALLQHGGGGGGLTCLTPVKKASQDQFTA
jgi:hypothetical protein